MRWEGETIALGVNTIAFIAGSGAHVRGWVEIIAAVGWASRYS